MGVDFDLYDIQCVRKFGAADILYVFPHLHRETQNIVVTLCYLMRYRDV